ncbi:MAG: Deoxyguanosinetriphosphate triphosphohydrolase-like protein [Gammaproteobacteria bacterium]|nr:Deoxyguanosinetriphosphate triphosphohydrolase-like protein [Gammaproteobacteria bacterium]
MHTENIYHAIKDPVHGTMQFTMSENNWLKPFIDSPDFQRLRHIKQLGMGDFIFPGAVHTRFNHCLGCAYIAGQISHKIGLAEEERQLVMIACLLHDIGHGPFSHTFEDLFHKKLIRHEAWTPFFLAEYRTKNFFSAYNHRNPRHCLTEEKFSLIEAMIMHKAPVKQLLADIVSSQLDADRLDYLLRDSHFCGVAYGEFDLRWMLNSMVIVDSNQDERLGLTHKGIGVVEHYLMARRLMTRNIYLHQKKLALESFLIKLLISLAENIDNYRPYAEIKKTRLGIFLSNANQFNQTINAATDLEQHKQNFLRENYANYKELCDYDVFAIVKLLAQMDIQHPAAQIAQRLHHRQMPKIIRLDVADIPHVKKQLAEFKITHHPEIQDWQLTLIQTPHQSYTVEDDPILITNEQGIVRPLNEMSMMIDAIGDKLEHTAFLCVDKISYANLALQNFIKDVIK